METISKLRRDGDDAEWKKCKEQVDRLCRKRDVFQFCISAKESYLLKPGNEKQLDHAHIYSASAYPDQIYNPKNVVLLSRYIHRRMDDYKNPLTGEPVDLNEHYYWWWRIAARKIADYNPDENYDILLRQLIFI